MIIYTSLFHQINGIVVKHIEHNNAHFFGGCYMSQSAHVLFLNILVQPTVACLYSTRK